MCFMQRLHNFLIMLIEWSEEAWFGNFDALYYTHFGPNFLSTIELSENAKLGFVNDEELFNYPRPISSKLIFVGGIGNFNEKDSQLDDVSCY